MREKDLERKLRDKVKQAGGLAFKFVSPGNAGVADRIVMMPHGRLWFIEMKAPGKTLTPLQLLFKEQANTYGFRHRTIDSEKLLDDFITELKNEI